MPADTTQLYFMKCLVPPVFTLRLVQNEDIALFVLVTAFLFWFFPTQSFREVISTSRFIRYLAGAWSCDSSPGHPGQGTK